MPRGKEEYTERSEGYRNTEELCDQVVSGELFGFLQVDIPIPNELIDKFITFLSLVHCEYHSRRHNPLAHKRIPEKYKAKDG